MLRHTLATLAYRAVKTLRGAPSGFPEFRVWESSRTPAQILAHMGDLLDWALSLSKGTEEWHDSQPLPWDEEIRRFHAALQALDDCLASDLPLGLRPSACSRARLPTRSHTSARSPCSAARRARPSGERTTSAPKSPPVA